jgi:hypothetical protein
MLRYARKHTLKVPRAWSRTMVGLFGRELIRGVKRLPLAAKIGIGLIVPVIFVVVTQLEQWERLTVKEPLVLTAPKGALIVAGRL